MKQPRDYPVARGVVPPPGYRAPSSRNKQIVIAAACIFASAALGWFLFQGPGAEWLRGLNYRVPEKVVAEEPQAKPVEQPRMEEKRKPEPPPVKVEEKKSEPKKEPASAKQETRPLPVKVEEKKSEPEKPKVSVSYNQVSAIFQSKCINCHSPPKKKGGLDMRTLVGIQKGGDSGPAVNAGKPEESPLWESIDTDRMPPDKTKRLTAAEKELIRRWIENGAK